MKTFHVAGLLGSLVTAPPVLAQQPGRPDSTEGDSLRRYTLEPITVSVTRNPTDMAHVPLAVSVITRDEIARGRATTGLDEVLVTVPGVYVANRYNPAQDHILSIRGFGARSAFGVRGLKVVLDGIPQTLPDGQGQLSNVDLAEVHRIEVLRGPSSALYGNASGGVVSLWTDAAPPDRPTASVRVMAGSYGLLKWQARGAAPVGSGSVSLAASETVTDGYRQHSSGITRRVSLRAMQAVAPRTRVTLHGLVAHSPNLEDPGALTAAERDTDPRLPNPRNLAIDADKKVGQGQAGLALRRDFASGGGLDFSVFGLRRELDNQLAFAFIDLNRWAWGGRTAVSLPFGIGPLAQVLTAGVDAQWQRDDRINLSPDRTTLTRDQLERVAEIGPFLQSQWTLGDASVTVGGRYDRVRFSVDDAFLSDGDDSGERVMTALSGAAGIALDIVPAVQPYVSLATSFETPTTTELANRPTGPGGFNPVLEPQTATNLEVGIRGTLRAQIRYSLALYSADVRGELIPFEVPGDPGRRFFRNAGSSAHRGVEADLTIRPVPGLSLLSAYAYSAATFDVFRTATTTYDGNALPGVPRHYLHWSVRYEAPGGLWVAADNTHASGYYVDDANTVRTEPWWTAGGRAGWQVRVGAWRVAPFAGLLNGAQQRYVGSVAVNATGGRYFEPAPGRNGYVGVEVSPLR
ncbi:MAG TPA: TonB-dependent receptor [Gemmatimonadales bacterium]